MHKRIKNPLDLSQAVAGVLTPFIADIIEFAHKVGPAKWGLTDYHPDVRINVGFTEVFTTSANGLRLIVDSTQASQVALPKTVKVIKGKNGNAYYPSIPNSICIEVPYRPLPDLRAVLNELRPALFEAISNSARRGLGRGVRAGHAPDLVREIGRFVGRSLPQPSHVSQPRPPSSRRAISVTLMEGALHRVISNRFERNRAARDECIAHHGSRCLVCKFSFGEAFGEIGEGFIHVHHITPVADARGRYVIDPVRHLVPVCPNCHAMLHIQDPPLTVQKLKELRRPALGLP